jgi:hypothetical protein
MLGNSVQHAGDGLFEHKVGIPRILELLGVAWFAHPILLNMNATWRHEVMGWLTVGR